ncbi:hypothetical protein [Lysinibacillus sp. G4S2]|uniref:hypothetical protein n=1 Tax=Lysinibacillus sp. G4S2 TaxID=3055859 RepID=UPI0025A25756|nr:hypothetical protein [Lysinibacillus sp. G4S2]MDM5247312.1 hypothetical protein [Lysinibacillus sp. G4S2]
MGISVTDETLERATRVKRLIGRPQESAQPERKSTTSRFKIFSILNWQILCYSESSQLEIIGNNNSDDLCTMR